MENTTSKLIPGKRYYPAGKNSVLEFVGFDNQYSRGVAEFKHISGRNPFAISDSGFIRFFTATAEKFEPVDENSELELLEESTGLKFKDISNEKNRIYAFSHGGFLQIDEPLFINVSKSGGHRVFAKNGRGYYVQPKEGWYIAWQNIDIYKPWKF